jgi:hypothetical protein
MPGSQSFVAFVGRASVIAGFVVFLFNGTGAYIFVGVVAGILTGKAVFPIAGLAAYNSSEYISFATVGLPACVFVVLPVWASNDIDALLLTGMSTDTVSKPGT